MRNTIILTTLATLATGCSDEIDFDYNSLAEPLPVIEAYVENGAVSVSITTTRDVADSARNHYVEDARVSLTGARGETYDVPYTGQGTYSAGGVACTEGGVYSLSVTIGGETFTATDTMGIAPRVRSYGFKWEEIIQSDRVTYHYDLLTPADSLANYVILMQRNSRTYKWKSFSNRSAYDGELDGRIMCFSQDDLDSDDDDDKDDVIWDGDVVDVLIAGVSRRVGNYYDELNLSGSTNANPEWSFSGRALGIFAARSVVRLPSITFALSDVEKQ